MNHPSQLFQKIITYYPFLTDQEKACYSASAQEILKDSTNKVVQAGMLLALLNNPHAELIEKGSQPPRLFKRPFTYHLDNNILNIKILT